MFRQRNEGGVWGGTVTVREWTYALVTLPLVAVAFSTLDRKHRTIKKRVETKNKDPGQNKVKHCFVLD
jgi:hypothetical protein